MVKPLPTVAQPWQPFRVAEAMTKLACNAAARGDVAELQRLFVAGGPLHKRPSAGTDPETGETPLHAAARGKRLGALQWLLDESGLDPQTRAKNGETAAHLAAFEGWLEGLEVLVEHDPQRRTLMITDKDLQGLNPLHVAIIRGQELVVQWVVSNFSADRLRLTEKGSLAVHYAAAAGRMGILRLIAEHIGTNAANAADDNNATPVYFAAQEGQLEAIQYMITECGADPKAKTTDGMQALHAATQNGHEEAVQWLVARIGRTALMETTDDGATAVHFASAAGHVSLLRWFFSTPNGSALALVKDSMHSTPLHDAIDYGHMDCLKLILRHGGDLFANDLDGVSPYSLAMECASDEMKDFILRYIQDKHLLIPEHGRKSASMARSGQVSHPMIPKSHGDDSAIDFGHPAVPKGSGFGGGAMGIRTRMTESEEIQAAQQQVMAHQLTSAREASTGSAVKDNRTRPMRQTSFRDLKPAGPFIPAAPVPPPPNLDDTEDVPPPKATRQPSAVDQPDGRPSPDGQERGPLSQEVNGWFASPTDELAVADSEIVEPALKADGFPTTPTGDAPSGGRRKKRGEQRSKRRKLQQQVPHYQYLPVYRPVMTPYGYMLTQTVMPMPIAPGNGTAPAAPAAAAAAGGVGVGGGSSRRGRPPGFNKTRSPQGSGPSSPMTMDSGSESGGGGGGVGYVTPDRRQMKRKDSGRMPLSVQQQTKSPASIAAMKSLASVNEEFAEEDEEDEENDTTVKTPTGESSISRQRRQSMASFSQSLSAMNTLGQSPMSMTLSPFSPFAQQQQQQLQAAQQSPAKQASFLRWLFNKPPPASTQTKSLSATKSSTAMGDYPYAVRRGSLPDGVRRTRATSVSSMDMAAGQDFMIGLDEHSYQHGSTLVAMALCTSVIGMSIVSAVPKKSIVPMLATAARRAVANFSLGDGGSGGGGVHDGKQRRRESRTTVETTGSNDITATQRGASKGDEQAKGAGSKVTRQLSRKISMRRAASTPELDKDAKEARHSSVWEFDMKMESRASTRWGSDETAPVDMDKIASLQRQGPRHDELAERTARQEKERRQQEEKEKQQEEKERQQREKESQLQGEKRRKEEVAERARIKAEEEHERREEEKAIRDAAKRAKQDEEKRKREQKEEELRRKKSDSRLHKDDELRRRQQEQLQRKQSKQDVKQADEQRKKDLAAQKVNEADERRKEAQQEQLQRKQSKQDIKQADEQRKKDLAAQKVNEADERRKQAQEEKEAEKQRKIDEKRRKEEEKERRKEADKEEKKRLADEKRRKKDEQQLLKEDQVRRKKVSKDEAKKKRNRTSTVSSDSADAGQTEKFLGQWESEIKMQTGDLSAVLDDLQATIDLDTDISAMYGGDRKIEEDMGVSELALALQLSGQAEMLSETMVYEEHEQDGQTAWQSSAAFEASAAAAILTTDAALDEVTRRPSLSSVAELMQPSRGHLGHSDAIPEAPLLREVQAPSDDFSAGMVPPPPAAPPNLMSTAEKEDQVGFLESTAVKPSQARKIWQQRSSASTEDSGISLSGSSTALHSMLSNSKTDLSGGRRPGSAGSNGGDVSSEAGAGGASELEYALNQRRKKAQNDFLSNYRKSADRPR